MKHRRRWEYTGDTENKDFDVNFKKKKINFLVFPRFKPSTQNVDRSSKHTAINFLKEKKGFELANQGHKEIELDTETT